jgi:16S rRNA (guanine966-N2)-methyltransferase
VRIVGGAWAGTDLVSPGRKVRPTGENVRTRWLDRLEPHLEGARVLDLFAGSGALGLEALSRGAASADFVEDGAPALHALKANIAKCGLRAKAMRSRARVFKRDAIPWVEALDEGAYDIVFADPPYGSRKLDRVLAAWSATRFGTILGVEHAKDHAIPAGGKHLDFGDTVVTIWGLPAKRRYRPKRGS